METLKPTGATGALDERGGVALFEGGEEMRRRVVFLSWPAVWRHLQPVEGPMATVDSLCQAENKKSKICQMAY